MVLWTESAHEYKLHFIRGHSTHLFGIRKQYRHPIHKQNKDKPIATQSNETNMQKIKPQLKQKNAANTERVKFRSI